MSLIDESFPEDDLHITRIDRKNNVSSSSSGNDQNLSASTSGQSSSGNSRETTQSDPVKTNEAREEEDYTQKVRSCQDLHSVYTKRRFPHVKSKVREFIENQKAEEELRRSRKEYYRRVSAPDALTSNCTDSQGEPDSSRPQSGPTEENSLDIAQVLVEKEQEMMCLKALNEYLQSSLQEKMIEATRLRRNVDSMRIELLHAKDKAKRHSMQSIGIETRNHYSPRLSLPTLIYKLPRNTIGTQTEINYVDQHNHKSSPCSTTDSNNNSYDCKSVATIQPISLNYITDHNIDLHRQIRRRTNSNPPTPTATTDQVTSMSKVESNRSDSAIDTEEGDSSSDNILREQFIITDKHSGNMTSTSTPNPKKNKRSFRKKLKWIFGPCAKCSEQRNTSVSEQYSQTPLLDSMFEHRIRVTDLTTTST